MILKLKYVLLFIIYVEISGIIAKPLYPDKEELTIGPEMFVKFHNEVRMKEKSSNMREMYWDEDLASDAKNLADQCRVVYPSNINCNGIIIRHTSITANELLLDIETFFGRPRQNCHARNTSYWPYITDTEYHNDHCKSYVQVIWANTYKLGCSLSLCKTMHESPKTCGYSGCSVLVCVYSPPGNILHENIFSSGEHCTNCDEGLFCDESLTAGLCRDKSYWQLQKEYFSSNAQSVHRLKIYIFVFIFSISTLIINSF